jgi:hypothetical protein
LTTVVICHRPRTANGKGIVWGSTGKCPCEISTARSTGYGLGGYSPNTHQVKTQ